MKSSELKERIKGKLAVVGIGNILRGDDGLGPKFIELLREKNIAAELFDCGTAPENYIFPIIKSSPDTLILVDAADLGLKPGSARIVRLDEISGISFSTHNPSPRLFTDLLKEGVGDIDIFVVSVQPKTAALGAPLSREVLQGLELLAGIFMEAVGAPV